MHISSLTKRLPKVGEKSGDFTIDVAYEFSKFVDQDNVRLTHIPEMCIVSGSDCATYPRQFHACVSSFNDEKYLKNIYKKTLQPFPGHKYFK